MAFLDNYITSFESISLEEMDSVSLMKRVDTKFVFNRSLLEEIFPLLVDQYKLLYVNDVVKSKYTSLYFDTKDFKFFMNHHNGKLNRSKVRFREYIDSQVSFLELKRKNSKGKTIKKRIQVDLPTKTLNLDQKQFIKNRLKEDYDLLYCHTNFFHRITMVNKFLKERITIDFDLRFESEKKTIKDETNHIVIAELKQEKLDRTSFFYKLMKENSIRPSSMSKYCIGTSLLNKDLKSNRFKKNFRFLKKNNH